MWRLIAPLFCVSCIGSFKTDVPILGAIDRCLFEAPIIKFEDDDQNLLIPLHKATPEEIQARVEFCVFFLETVLWKIELMESWVKTVNSKNPNSLVINKQVFDLAKQHIDLIKVMLGLGLEEIYAIDPSRLKSSVTILRQFISEIGVDNNARILCDKVIQEILEYNPEPPKNLKG